MAEEKGKIIKPSKFKNLKDDASNIFTGLFGKIVIPQIKKTIYDLFTASLSRVLYKDGGNPERDRRRDAYVSYSRSGNSYTPDVSYRDERVTRRSTYDIYDYIFNNYLDAQEVLDDLKDVLITTHKVRVAEFYHSVNKFDNEKQIPYLMTDEDWGWTNLDDARIESYRSGFHIVFPKLENLKD